MLQLLQPLWLLAAAAIAWPVLLHFWNDRQGRVLRIGSIALLERHSPRRAWSRRLSERWLLLLRCFLLAVLSLLLAGPSWKSSSPSPQSKGWLLIAAAEPNAVAPSSAASGTVDPSVSLDPEAQRLYGPLIDSLSAAGYERRLFVDPMGPARALSFWSAFRAADRTAPENLPFVTTSPAWVGHFHGTRPFSDRPVKWHTYIPRDSTRHWIESAWLSSPDTIRLTEGFSAPEGTRFQYHSLPVRPGTIGDFRIGLNGGRLSVSLENLSAGIAQSPGVAQTSTVMETPVIVDTATLRIAIYADRDRRQDSRYIAAAIRACALFVKKRIQVDVTTAGAAARPAPSPDWLFWLSSAPVPATTASHILQYEPGLAVTVDTWMQGVGGIKITKYVPYIIAAGSSDTIAATSTDTASADFAPIWQDGYGHPLLNEENRAGRRVYHFYGRFDPAWNDLVWSPHFPELLGELLFHNDRATTGPASIAPADSPDRRMLDPEQVLPIIGHTEHDSNNKAAATIDLTPALGIFLLLLFIAERIISFRSSPLSNYGRAVGTK